MYVKVTDIYHETLRELRTGTRRIIHQGGQWSGKTVNILPALMTAAIEDTEPGVTTITSMSFPHLKGGALRDFEMYTYPHFKSSVKQYHKTDHLFTLKNGAIIEFKVYENEMTARGAKRKRLFINEANSFNPLIFFQLDSRSEQTIIDYNPSISFWAHDNLIGQPGNVTFYSDHRSNPFMTDARHREIEAICTFERDKNGKVVMKPDGTPSVLKGDFELWKVYARGLTGNIMGVIFPNWEMIDEAYYPTDVDNVYSVDFGYTNDPTAIIKQCKIGDTLFVKELAYETALPPQSIRQILLADGYQKDEPLYCEHDPDMIKALRNLELTALPARKGQGSVNAGIELLKTFKVKYTNTSKNLHRERSKYVWVRDDKTGKLTNIPVDNNNHCFDAIRYGAYTRYLRQVA